jgi:RNA polymerase sigma-70 factor (ECF subfamily)
MTTEDVPGTSDAEASIDAWATAYQPGSAPDFDRLYRNSYPRLKRILTAVLGDADAAEDCVQDAFVRAFQAWSKWRPEAPAEMWLQRIALNRAFSYRRKMALREIGQVLRRLGRPEPPPDPSEALEWTELRHALRRLPVKVAAVVVLRHYHGYTNRDIAHLVGVSERTIGARLSEGRRLLREDLGSSSGIDVPTFSAPRVLYGDGQQVST